MQRRLSKCYFIHNKSQSWHLMNDHSRMIEIIGIRNYAFHDPMPGRQLIILWQNAVSDLYISDHQWVDISLGSILERFIPQSKVDHSKIWSFVKCGFLPISKHGDHMQTAQTEKILVIVLGKITDLNTCYLLTVSLNVAHDLMMIILISVGKFIWR